MVVYDFKTIRPIPEGKDLIDIVLSRVQRKTPTVVHRRYAISRIREFYMRKVKFAQQTYLERINQILEDFPRLESIHPFYADLINVLYDRDHYKLALGQLNVARSLVENVGKDYIKLLKFGDSLYRCKMLKRAALGRMCTVVKKQSASLAYLEQVRQHLVRLPSIDPTTRTLLITGYPNCGKSSFINQITRAEVEVQPYAFTTKSLFVGHCDYKYLRWQVIDTPGILDHPLEERNTIEMQAITALAHLNCAVHFFMDISGHSQYSIEQQVSLFKNIQPLFANKPVVVVASKSDVRQLAEMPEEEAALVRSISSDVSRPLLQLSNITTEGVHEVRTAACDLLLAQRVDNKINTKKVDAVLNRIHIATPKPRDSKQRPVSIPESVILEREQQKLSQDNKNGEDSENEMMVEKKKTIKDVQDENGGAGVFSFNWREHWKLDNDEWKYDEIPEIFLGKNVLDFYDPDIVERLDALEREEEELAAEWEAKQALEEGGEIDEEHLRVAAEIKKQKTLMRDASRIRRSNNYSTIPRKDRSDVSVSEMEEHLTKLGAGEAAAVAGARIRGRSRTPKLLGKRTADEMDVDKESDNEMQVETTQSRLRALSRVARSRSRSKSCFRDAAVSLIQFLVLIACSKLKPLNVLLVRSRS